MVNNFFDKETGEEFFISNYKLFYTPSGKVYKDSNFQVIKNPKNGNVLEYIEKEFEIGIPFIMKSNNKENMVKMLKDRSHEHFKKEISEIKYEKNKKLINDFQKGD